MAVELKDYDGVVDTKPAKSGDGSYVLLYTKCVKPTQQCAKGGKLHGPYWYPYTKKDGKTKCRYIGKNLSGEV